MTPQAPLTRLRVLGRISVALILDIVDACRMEREFVDALVILAVVQANVTPVAGDPGLQRAYADYESPPPDALRRPVSISAVAQSLKLPYETVRRRVAQLAGEPGFELTPQGLVVRQEMLNSPAHRQAVVTNYQLIRDFYLRLRRLGALDEVAAAAAPPQPGAAPPVRAVARVSSDYMLRIVDLLITHIGDVVRGLVFLGILRANTEHFADDERGSDAGGPASFLPDELRRPVTVAALSARLGIPHETVRRHAARLVEDRMCVRGRDGLIVPAHVLARPTFVRLMGDNNGYVRRTYAALARLGVVAEWERLLTGEAVLA
jgi:DNA-binding Lrp family transcriptional regulator